MLFGKLDKQSGQLEAITASLHKLGAQAGPSVRDMLDIGSRVATAVVVIFAALVAGILHLAKVATLKICARLLRSGTSWNCA